MKNIYIILSFVCILVSGCRTELQHVDAYAALSVIPVMPQTKSTDPELIKASMRVFIVGRDFNESYLYSELPEVIYVPADSEQSYLIAAQNVTEDEALISPDIWGQKRYAGAVNILLNRITKPDSEEQYVYSIEVPCEVVNSMVSVNFDPTIEAYFKDYNVSTYTDEGRVLVFGPSNASSALAHFTSGKSLKCVFSGIFNVTGETVEYPFEYYLEAADHVTFTFSLRNVEGTLSKPEINVDKSYEEFDEDVVVDPSDNGVIE